jgi:16S rRNA processing protein RimM
LEYVDGRKERIILEETWEHKGREVLKFAGIDTISSAESIVGCWVMVPVEKAVPLPKGTYYDHDLIGCSVQDAQGKIFGQVEKILHFGENSLLSVRGQGKEYLIPVVESICTRISIEEKTIILDPPDGLMDLGQ